MSGLVTFIYGGALAAIVVTTWIGVLPQFFLPILVILMGVLIFFTPLAHPMVGGQIPQYGSPVAGPRFQWIRRYVFGIYLILVGGMSYVDLYTTFPFGTNISVYSFSGQLIILGIAAIYFLATFERTRNIPIHSY